MRQLFMNDRLPFEKPELVESEAVKKILNQLSDKEVYVRVLGRNNVGKSTLINALLSAEWVNFTESHKPLVHTMENENFSAVIIQY